MKRRFALLAVSASFIAAVPAASPASAVSGPVAHAACTQAKIGGQSKCIGRGQYCAKARERDYRRYGFTCSKQDRNGRWHLQ